VYHLKETPDTSWAFKGGNRLDIFNKKFTTIADFIEVVKADLV